MTVCSSCGGVLLLELELSTLLPVHAWYSTPHSSCIFLALFGERAALLDFPLMLAY